MAKDYYKILGASLISSKEDVKKAFHKLAHKYHPDRKGGDESKFKEINEAYQTLSDDSKRSQYDTYGSNYGDRGGTGAGWDPGGFQGFPGGAEGFNFDFGDIFNGFDFFSGASGGRQRTQRGRDISIDIEIPFAESVFGTERKILLTKSALCDICNGNGGKPGAGVRKCDVCNGKGAVREVFFGAITTERVCGACSGKGETPKEKCANCHGAGAVRKSEEIFVTIPPGIADGEMIRMTGLGEAAPRGIPGDLYVKMHVQADRNFVREGNNIITNIHIKISDALLGSEYSLQTLEGEKITLVIPAGISDGELLRIRNKGVPIGHKSTKRGDLLVRVRIQIPKGLSIKQKELLNKLRAEGL